MSARPYVVLMMLAFVLATAQNVAADDGTGAGSVVRDLVGIGGECTATVHVSCGDPTADGACHLYIGGSSESCVVYGGDPVVSVGGDCNATVHFGCNTPTAPSQCAVYIGGSNGACLIY